VIGFVILVVLFLIGIWVYVELAKFPGKKAREREHPQAEAISVLSWVGLLFGGVPWLIALVWAYTRPVGSLAATAGDVPLDAAINEEDRE
jgi:hypothetical protein